MERLGTAGRLLELGLDGARRVLRTLDRALRHAGNARDRSHVTDDEHVRMARNGQVGKHLHAAGAVDLCTGLLGDLRAQRARGHPGRPHLAGGFDPACGAVGVLDRQSFAVDVDDPGARAVSRRPSSAAAPAPCAPSLAPIGASTAGPASSRITRACVESIWRKSLSASGRPARRSGRPIRPRSDRHRRR